MQGAGVRVVDLDLGEVKKGLDEGSILLVDVREAHEFAAGHIPGSVSHPLSTLDPEAFRHPERPVVFSCAAGVRSVRALEIAQVAGLDLERHYCGGFKEWWLAGEPIA